MMRATKRVAVLVPAPTGGSRLLLAGAARFVSSRLDWSVRWSLTPDRAFADLAAWRPNGLLVICGATGDASNIPRLATHVVIAGSHSPATDLAAATCDLQMLGRLAAEHLCELGHRDLACVCFDCEEALEQRRGFVEAARENEIEPETIVVACPMSGIESHPQAAVATWIGRLRRPSGLFVVCDRLAANICELAHEARIAVPDELAIVSSGNDVDAATVARPALSTVEQPLEHIGFQAAALLDELFTERTPRRLTLAPERVSCRESTERLAVDDVQVSRAIEFIRKNAHRQIGVRDVLKVVSASRRSIEQRFRRVMRRTILEEIRRARLELATQLLTDGDAPMDVVARGCGLGSSTQLGLLIRRYRGLTPLELRHRAQRGS